MPQTVTPTFLQDTRLTWKPQTEKMERSSLQKLALMRKLAGTNKSRLDKVQNMALRVILGAMKTTPVHDMEKQPM